MVRILFICHGNVCRSPMAQFVMADLAARAGRTDVECDSAATSREEIGGSVHRGTRRVLERAGIACPGHAPRQLTPADYGRFDLLVGMDHENLPGICRLLLGERGFGWGWDPVTPAQLAEADPEHKVSLLLDWTGSPRDVADPWYTGDFETTYADVLAGCEALLRQI